MKIKVAGFIDGDGKQGVNFAWPGLRCINFFWCNAFRCMQTE